MFWKDSGIGGVMEPLLAAILLFVFAFVCGMVGMGIGRGKGRERSGFWWGFLLGIVGIIIIALLPPLAEGKRRPCPSCAEMVLVEATKCRFCGESLAGAT